MIMRLFDTKSNSNLHLSREALNIGAKKTPENESPTQNPGNRRIKIAAAAESHDEPSSVGVQRKLLQMLETRLLAQVLSVQRVYTL